MRAIYGRFVTKVDEIKSFSWGEAAFMEIHNSLFRFCKDAEKKSSKESKVGIGGCIFALMAFAFQYIRPLRKLYKDYRNAITTHAFAEQSISDLRWAPPPHNWLKHNFDGAIFEELEAIGIGAAI
ncbi:hypothetical protein ACH5RR_013092 [Cinchona calisaya]|uniref:Aminotransferase-like plant mobile domain-containing protein n=1 Tax=Cinchona calisaya TaxID=153742 RepID=A0ABD2ZZ23_9GENT